MADGTERQALADFTADKGWNRRTIDRVDVYLRERHEGERFLDTYRRVGMQPFKEAIYG